MLLKMYEAMYGRWGHQGWWPAETRLEMMVGAMLTQNAAWGNVEKALVNLRSARLLPLKGEVEEEVACAGRMHEIGPKQLAPLIKPAGYYNLKAQRLWNLLDWFVGKYGGRFEAMAGVSTELLRRELLAVKGVGKETADSILLYALGRESFVIDAYTHRIFKRHGLAVEEADYDELQKLAVKKLPRDTELWKDYHAQLVNVGKFYCKPTARCEGCPLEKFERRIKER